VQTVAAFGEPRVLGAIDVDDDEATGRDRDVGTGVLRPPRLDLFGFNGGVVETCAASAAASGPGHRGRQGSPVRRS
jgi:hypothetical protein